MRVRPLNERELASYPSSGSTPRSAFPVLPAASSLVQTPSTAQDGPRKIIRVVDDRVLVFDPPESNPLSSLSNQILSHHARAGKKVKDMRFCFDKVYGERASQADVYQGSAAELIPSVLAGYNATVFAYGVRVLSLFDLSGSYGCVYQRRKRG